MVPSPQTILHNGKAEISQSLDEGRVGQRVAAGNCEPAVGGMRMKGRGAKGSRVGATGRHSGPPSSPEKIVFRARIRRKREIDTVGQALVLRRKTPEESIEIMFDMAESMEDIAGAVEAAGSGSDPKRNS
jgi:hypothetical protein